MLDTESWDTINPTKWTEYTNAVRAVLPSPKLMIHAVYAYDAALPAIKKWMKDSGTKVDYFVIRYFEMW